MEQRPVAVTGATGYVGGRLVPMLLERGQRVRVLGRSKAKLACRPWSRNPALEIAQCDVMEKESVKKALEGCRAVYYLIHSMNPKEKDFAEADRKAARNMYEAAGSSGIERQEVFQLPICARQ